MFDFEVCQVCGCNDQEVDIYGSGKHGICSDCDVDGDSKDLAAKILKKLKGED